MTVLTYYFSKQPKSNAMPARYAAMIHGPVRQHPA